MSRSRLLVAVLIVALLTGPVAVTVTVSAAHPADASPHTDSEDERPSVDVGLATEAAVDAAVAAEEAVDADLSGVAASEGGAVEIHLDERVVDDIQQWGRPGWLLFVGYSRYDSSCPLENSVRRKIHEAIQESPGIYQVELAAETQIPRSTIRYHVRILEAEKLISSEKVRGKQRYFPRGSDDVELQGALRDDTSRSVLVAIDRLEPVSVTALASELDRTPSTISYHLTRLADTGLIEQARADGTVQNRLAERTRQGLERHLDGESDVAAGSAD